jgi:predicted ATPase
MDALRIQNLRSLEDTGWVDLKPLTLLVGKNSSGKSTFLRCFPLFRQSVESRIVGPILWLGNYVDFGSFEEAIRQGSNNIAFHFRFSSPLEIPPLENNSDDDILSQYKFEVTILTEKAPKNRSYQIIHTTIQFADHTIKFSFNNEKIIEFTVNTSDLLPFFAQADNYNKNLGDILPTFISQTSLNSDKNSDLLIKQIFPSIVLSTYFYSYLQIKLKGEPIDIKQTHRIIESITPGSYQQIWDSVQNITNIPPFWKKLTEGWSINNNDFKEFCTLILLGYIPHIIRLCNQQINQFASNVVYIAPLRATAERYYRITNLETDIVDPRGENLPIILINLKPILRKNFNKWLQKQFGFEIELETNMGHVSIKLKDSHSKKSYNIADKGFGFSQILPIVTQLWMSIYLPPNKNIDPAAPIFFAIEQPELHLHPELQAQLAQAFVVAIQEAKEQKRDLRLIIETHSETIINKLGQLIDDKKVDNQDINVVVFDKRYPDEPTKVTFSHYNEEGYLVNWPWGFFEPEGLA